MLLKNSEYFNKILLVVGLADLSDLIKVINDELFMLVKELKDIIVVIVERVAVYLGCRAKLSDRYIGKFFSLDKNFQRLKKSCLCSDNPYVSCSLHIPYLTYKIDIINIPL